MMNPTTTSCTKPISRREFLYCMWAASAGLVAVGAGGVAIWLATPRLSKEEQARLLELDPSTIPLRGASPIGYPVGKRWISHTDRGLLALFMYCTRHPYGTFFKWVPANNRFECPQCGSKFTAKGAKINGEGPAWRNLDWYPIYATMPNGSYVSNSPDGEPLDIQGATRILIDTRKVMLGKPAS
jgi:hypothetical protein